MSYINEQNLTEFDKNIKEYIDNKLLLDKERFAYGIEWDITVSDPHCTRIGNPELHRTLPLQSSMKGCLLADDGTVNEYLPEDDWSNSVLDGSKGQVMVELPDMYVKFESEGNKRRAWMSTMPLVGFHLWKKCYVSAYEVSIQRSTNKLCSVCNLDPDYRGGDNTAEWDGTYRSLLGRPVSNLNIINFRNAAHKRGSSSWNCYLYNIHKVIFWLFSIEYATFNSQDNYTEELTSEEYHKGGLGPGVAYMDYNVWGDFNTNNPFIPCGYTNSFGNKTGVINYTVLAENGSELQISKVNRYRGIENPFGHMWKWSDGIIARISANVDKGGDGLSKNFVCSDPTKFNDTNYSGYKYIGKGPRNTGYVREIIFGENGEIMPSLVMENPLKYFCDYHYLEIPSSGEQLCGVLFGGDAHDGQYAGLTYAISSYLPTSVSTTFGTRLCYIP